MPKVEFRVGTDNTAQTIEATREAIKAALESVGLQAEAHAKNNITAAIPRYPSWYSNTGNLRNSITHEADDESVVIGTNVEYAVYNELGTGRYAEGGGRTTPWKYIGSDGEWHLTSGITAVHFLRNAIQDHLGEYEQIIADELTKRMS